MHWHNPWQKRCWWKAINSRSQSFSYDCLTMGNGQKLSISILTLFRSHYARDLCKQCQAFTELSTREFYMGHDDRAEGDWCGKTDQKVQCRWKSDAILILRRYLQDEMCLSRRFREQRLSNSWAISVEMLSIITQHYNVVTEGEEWTFWEHSKEFGLWDNCS